MKNEQTTEMWKEFRRRQAAHVTGPANSTAEALAEWNEEGEALDTFKKHIETLEDR